MVDDGLGQGAIQMTSLNRYVLRSTITLTRHKVDKVIRHFSWHNHIRDNEVASQACISET